jgi:hypothetical protein
MLAEPPTDAPALSLDSGAEPLHRLSTGRRATSFNEFQWLVLGTAVAVGVFINAVGLWLARAGRAAGEESIAAGVTTYIFDNLQAFKSAFTGLAVLLAALAVFSMRTAIIDNRNLPLATYIKLRQYHRLVGYGALALAFAVGLLTCVGIFGFGTDSPRSVLHSILGAALLVALVAKVAVVRYFPAQRRYLKLLGEGVLVLFILVFASSVVPFLWEQFSGGGANGYYYGR